MFKRSVSNKSTKGTKLGESIFSIVILSIVLFVILRIIMPSDVLSTAKFFDSHFQAPLVMLPAGTSFLGIVFPGQTSATGLAVGVALFLGTIVVMYGISTNSEGWLTNGKEASMKEVVYGLATGNIKASNVNQELMSDGLILMLLIFLDIVADSTFYLSNQVGGGPIWVTAINVFKAFLAALIINTILSEYMAVKATGLWLVAFGQIKGAILDDFPSLRRKGNERNKSQPKRPPLPSRNQPPKTSRIKSRPSPPPPTDQPFVMESRTAPSMNITMPEPNFDE